MRRMLRSFPFKSKTQEDRNIEDEVEFSREKFSGKRGISPLLSYKMHSAPPYTRVNWYLRRERRKPPVT